MRNRAFSRAWLMSFLGGSLVACGSGPVTSMPDGGGNTDPVLYDDLAPTCAMSCAAGTIATACTCTPVTFGAGHDTTRTSCASITGGRARTPERDYCLDGASGTAPDLSCMMTPPAHAMSYASCSDPGARCVTLYGLVDIFANGGDSNNITVEVFREGPSGALGEMVGSYVSTTGMESGATASCAEEEIEVDSSGTPTNETRRLGFYHIENVPTETPLIVRTRGEGGLWSPLVTYNFRILNAEVAPIRSAFSACISGAPTGDGFFYRARVLSHDDYGTIPLTAGLASGIAPGHGAIAGEVHDCGDVRVSLAQVGISPAPRARVYFNDIADNPLPAVGQIQGTSLLGLYSGLDLPPGPVDVAAIGYVDGQTVSLGWYHAQIFADSVTAVTLRGIRASQVP